MISLLYSAYNNLQNGINYGYAIANQIFHKEKNDESQAIILNKINDLDKKIFHEIHDLYRNVDQVLDKVDTLYEKIEQIDFAQIYLREEMENIGRYRDIESIKKCETYIKKINGIVKLISIALSNRSISHEPVTSSKCHICIAVLNNFIDNLMKIEKYIQLATPYLHSFRSSDIRSELVEVFTINRVKEGIDFLVDFIEGDQENSCLYIYKVLERFTTIFSYIQEEIAQVSCFMDSSIKEEQLRRPSLQKLSI